MSSLKVTLNGERTTIPIDPSWRLLRALREGAGLTGTKEGCSTGACGACTVLLDGQPVYSCLLPAPTAAGSEITTIEGLAGADGRPHPLQQAFVDHGAIQCGFCIPGMLMSAYAYVRDAVEPDEASVREALGGNICRCTGYVKIVDAVLEAAREGTSRGGMLQ
jgi:aerobic-type carbon monoxide dehydrogenase small subunit (CoxS/CutS family)